MILSKLTSKSLISTTLASGLIFSNAFTSALAAEMTHVGYGDTPVSTEQKTLLGRAVATSLGALGGVVVYSLVTGDWSWVLLITETVAVTGTASTAAPVTAAAGAATAGSTVAAVTTTAAAAEAAAAATAGAAEIASTVVTAAGATATPAAAATAAPATAVGSTAVPSIGAAARATGAAIWANKWMPVTASGLTGAILGNVIYSNR